MSFIADLLIKYKGQASPQCLIDYRKEDEWVILNEDDPDLHPIWVKLPQAGTADKCHTIDHQFAPFRHPEYHEMSGWGLPKMKQKYKKWDVPKRLVKLMKDNDNDPERIWPILQGKDAAEWSVEIKWIKKVIRTRFTGEWQWIKGKPTFIDGWHFIYLNFWRFSDATPPNYTNKDRKWYHAIRYAYITTECPLIIDGHVQYEDTTNGIKRAIMVDYGKRTMIGYLYPKGRREGATNKHLCAQYLETILRFGIFSGIVADSGDKSEEIYSTILLPGWRQMIFFFKPMTGGYDDPAGKLSFKPHKSRSLTDRERAIATTKALRSEVDYSNSATGTDYDGLKKLWLLADEGGKTKTALVDARHKILVLCVAQGNRARIGGFMGMPSTVGEMNKKGGAAYFRLATLSHYEDRDLLGQTPSGLMNFFFDSAEGLEGYVDEFGDTVLDTPKNPVMGIDGKLITLGSRDALTSQRAAPLKKGDLEAYNEEVRLYPRRFRECFRTQDGEIGFNVKNIDEQIDELKFGDHKGLIGDFDWVNGVFGGKVEFTEKAGGRWYVTKLIAHNNKRIKDGDTWFPDPRYADEFTCGGDPFKANKTEGTRMSKGGGSVFWNFDEKLDGDKPLQEWSSHTTVATYLFRPNTLPEYCEDMLKQSIYYNSRSFPEIDVPAIWHYFEEHSFGGYLKYDIDNTTRLLKKTPGFTSRGSQQRLFNAVRDYIEKHCHREKHLLFLEQCKGASSLDDFTDLDLLVANGGAIMGSLIVYANDEQKKQQKAHETATRQIFRTRTYST